jgi:membrane protein implicated in regulation of membrane protease activity
MQYIFAGICLFGAVATMVFLRFLHLGGWLTAAILIPLVLLAVYSLARIQPKETKSEKDTGK